MTMLMDCLVSAATSSSVIMFLAAAAMVSSWMMTVANVPAIVTGILAPFINHPTLLMMIICIIVLLVGTSMDATPTIMILFLISRNHHFITDGAFPCYCYCSNELLLRLTHKRKSSAVSINRGFLFFFFYISLYCFILFLPALHPHA